MEDNGFAPLIIINLTFGSLMYFYASFILPLLPVKTTIASIFLKLKLLFVKFCKNKKSSSIDIAKRIKKRTMEEKNIFKNFKIFP